MQMKISLNNIKVAIFDFAGTLSIHIEENNETQKSLSRAVPNWVMGT